MSALYVDIDVGVRNTISTGSRHKQYKRWKGKIKDGPFRRASS